MNIEKVQDENEDIREEMQMMTQRYLQMKSERDKFHQQLSSIRSDLKNFDIIIGQRVQEASVFKDKEIQRLKTEILAQKDTILKLEDHKECYNKTINYLEDELRKVQDELYDAKLEAETKPISMQEVVFEEKRLMNEMKSHHKKQSIDSDVMKTTEGDIDYSFDDVTGGRLNNQSEYSTQVMGTNQPLRPSVVKERVSISPKKGRASSKKRVTPDNEI